MIKQSIVLLLLTIVLINQNLSQINKNNKTKIEDLYNELDDKLTLRFYDALNGKPIIGADIEIGELLNDKTDFEGKVIFEIPVDGEYLINFSHSKYVKSILKMNVIVGTIFNNRFSISPELPIEYLRVVLDWGKSPLDLDAHLIKSKVYHISYRNLKVSNDNSTKLDRDDMDGFGPETITTNKVDSRSEYKYFVHDFSNKSDNSSSNLTKSNARILIFGDNKLLHSIQANGDATGNYWEVFRIVNGKIEIVNEIKNTITIE